MLKSLFKNARLKNVLQFPNHWDKIAVSYPCVASSFPEILRLLSTDAVN